MIRGKKALLKEFRRGVVGLLAAAVITNQVMPISMIVNASESEVSAEELPQSEETEVDKQGQAQEATEEVTEETTTESSTEGVTEETTTENSTEGVTEETATESSTEGVTEETATESSTEGVTEETTSENSTEEVTEETTTENSTEEVTEETATESSTEEVTEEMTTESFTEEEMTEEVGYIQFILHAQGGNCDQEIVLADIRDQEICLPECYKEGYVFTGWYFDEVCTIPFSADEVYWIEGLSYDLFAAYEEVQPTLESRVMNTSINGMLITVSGMIPEAAELQVEVRELSQQVKQDISSLSNVIDTIDELENIEIMYSYDITIMCDGNEYEPYLQGEELEVRFMHMNRSALSEVAQLEVFHVSEQHGVERVNVVSKSDYEVVIHADEFSQYIVIGDVAYNQQTHWDFDYQEFTQSFEAPAKGIYKIELYGAQGSNYGSYAGGLGGMVTAYVELGKNQVIEIITGGQNSFHGGNQGTVSNGGGATELRIDGQLAAIAGGGGGAGTLGEGGKGGLSTETQKVGIINRGIATESFGGGAGYQNGQDGYVLMHEHTGNAADGGGCFTKTNYIYHSHNTSGCKYIQNRCTSTDYIRDGWWPQVQGENPCEHAICRKCAAKHTGPRDGSAGFDYSKQCGNVISQYWGCGKTENALDGVEFALGCEKDEATVDGMVMSTGGSNFYQTQVCQNVATAAGANAGNGKAAITLMQIDAATISYYETASKKITTIAVEKGTYATYPVTFVPQKETDSKYSYSFVGWDDMATQTVETLQAQETVSAVVLQDRNYIAVYEKAPRSYTITLQNQNADEPGTQQILAQYGLYLPTISIPQKTDYIFAGYYTKENGAGTRIYREDGTGEDVSGFEQDTTLYAYWISPLGITQNPSNVTVQAGYNFAVMDTEAILTSVSGYSMSYQWYVSTREDRQDACKIDGAVGTRLTIPSGYQVGTYYIYCEITAISAYNGQTLARTTEAAKFVVEKGILMPNQLQMKAEKVIYDGKAHTVEVDVSVQSEIQIYYSTKPLTKENYQSIGTVHPLSYTDAGVYPVYVYLTGTNYQDYTGIVTLTIQKAMPTVYLANRNTAYNKKQQGIGSAKVYGVNQISLSTPVEYSYYTDEKCTQLTNKIHGATHDGGQPSKVGTYYVQAKVKETANYTSAALSQPAMFNIIATKSMFSVLGYHGIYDGKAHGLKIEIDDEDTTTFWFSDTTELTKENYQEVGTKDPYTYTKVGKYTIYYIAVTKITGWIYDYTTGSATIIIERAQQSNGDGNGQGNGNGSGDKVESKPSDVVVIPEPGLPLVPELPDDSDESVDTDSEEKDSEGTIGDNIPTKNETEKENSKGDKIKLNTVKVLEEADKIEENELVLVEQSTKNDASKLLLLMDSVDELTPQELEMLKQYLEEIYPSQEQEEEDANAVRKNIVTGSIGILLGTILGAGLMFWIYPWIHLIFLNRRCVKGKCTERAQHMKLLIETSKGVQKVEKKKNGAFCISKLQKGETYLLKGITGNGKTMVLMKIQPQTWNMHYELAEIAGLQIQVKENRGGLKVQIR